MKIVVEIFWRYFQKAVFLNKQKTDLDIRDFSKELSHKHSTHKKG